MINPIPLNIENLSKTIADTLNESVEANGKASLAIPGGRSPGPILANLAKVCEEKVSNSLYLYWVDERCVVRGHADRNDHATLGFWKDGGKEPAFVRSMPAENDDLAQAVIQYTNTLIQDGFELGMDVALLGIGEDGHFASLFPNHPALKETAITFSLSDSPKPPPKRLSLSLPYILSSKKVIVLVTGTGKGEVLKKAVSNPGDEYPVSLLFDNENVSYYLDSQALEAFQA